MSCGWGSSRCCSGDSRTCEGFFTSIVYGCVGIPVSRDAFAGVEDEAEAIATEFYARCEGSTAVDCIGQPPRCIDGLCGYRFEYACF